MKIVWSKTADKPFLKSIVAVKRRTTTTYLHEEHAEYDYSVHQG
nr:hypothetical protein [Klebsiella quasipneumoniae]